MLFVLGGLRIMSILRVPTKNSECNYSGAKTPGLEVDRTSKLRQNTSKVDDLVRFFKGKYPQAQETRT